MSNVGDGDVLLVKRDHDGDSKGVGCKGVYIGVQKMCQVGVSKDHHLVHDVGDVLSSKEPCNVCRAPKSTDRILGLDTKEVR